MSFLDQEIALIQLEKYVVKYANERNGGVQFQKIQL